MYTGIYVKAKNMSRLANGRKAPIADPVGINVRVERLTRDNARSLGLNQTEILRTALEQAVEEDMRKYNFTHPDEIPQAEHSSWLSNLRWW